MTTLNTQTSSSSRHLMVWLGLSILTLCTVSMFGFYAPGSHFHSRLTRELFDWPLALGLIAGYSILMHHLRVLTNWPSYYTPLLIVSALLLSALAASTTPFHSTDVYGYINRGWQQSAYQTNPYTTLISQLPHWQNDPMLTNHWVNNPCPYGFAFAQGVQYLTQWGKGSLANTLALFKSANWLLHVGVGILLAMWSQQGSPRFSQAALVAWSEWIFHPLLWVHHLANGHNDVWMGGLLALAMVISMGKHPLQRGWTLPGLMLSGLIKYATLLLWPLWAFWLVKTRQWAELILGFIMSALLLTVLGWPYWKGLLHHAPVEQLVGNATLTHSSIHSLLYYGFRTLAKALDPEWLAAAPWVFNGFKVLLAFVLLWAILWSLGSLLRANLPDAVSTTNSPSNRLIPAWSPLLTLLCVVVGIVSLKFYPWYVGMVLPAVFLLPQSHPLRSMVSAVALVQVLSITLLGQARMADCLLLLIIPALWAFKRLSKNTTLKAGA